MTLRHLAIAAAILTAAAPERLGAQVPPTDSARGRLSASDSALIYRILSAEDRRDAGDSSLARGSQHSEPRIAQLAARALARIIDSSYADRRNGPTYAPRVTWPFPAWRPRLDSLRGRRDDCAAMAHALDDPALQVRIRAADLVRPSCRADGQLLQALQNVLTGRAAAHPVLADHALLALARLRPDTLTREQIQWAARAPRWLTRVYAARAAGPAADTATLRRLVADRDDNVKEAAIEELARLTGHADDALFLRALNASGAQAVRAAAIALAGSTHPESPRALDRALRRWLARPNDSERDARLALLAAAGRPVTDDRRWSPPAPLPSDVVRLALGADVRLRVTMAGGGSGGSFIVRLRGDVAPITAARILELARRGYYNGMLWQRVVSDFVVQGGGPGANEYVGYPRFFRDELGTVSHRRGGVGMSTRGHDTGDGQWFIDLGDNARLDKEYTLFGEVIEGMTVVDDLCEGDRIASIRPVE